MLRFFFISRGHLTPMSQFSCNAHDDGRGGGGRKPVTGFRTITLVCMCVCALCSVLCHRVAVDLDLLTLCAYRSMSMKQLSVCLSVCSIRLLHSAAVGVAASRCGSIAMWLNFIPFRPRFSIPSRPQDPTRRSGVML